MSSVCRLVVTGLFFLILSLATAFAEHPACVGLRDALTRASTPAASSGGNSGDYQRYSSMVRQQSRALKSAKRDVRNLRCKSNRNGECRALVSKVNKMQANLTKLTSLRDSAKGNRSKGLFARNSKSEARKIRRQMRRHRCGQDNTQANGERRRGLFDLLFNGRNRRSNAVEEAPVEQTKKYGRTFRTLCVRQCDGYYFPVSFATVRGQFTTDQASCSALCPGAKTELYAYRNPQEGPEEMVSISGEPYVDAENAFRYRREVVSSCSCKPQGGVAELRDVALTGVNTAGISADEPPSLFGNGPLKPVSALDGSEGTIVTELSIPTPTPKPAPNIAHDPDTRMAIIGQFNLKAVEPNDYVRSTPAAQDERLYNPETLASNGIRIVGPVFLDDQGSEELLIDPAHVPIQ